VGSLSDKESAVIEMRVRQVSHHASSGSDVVVLEAEMENGSPTIALAVSRADALSLRHEIGAEATPRVDIYDLLVRVVGAAGSTVEHIQIHQAGKAMAHASLRIEGPHGAVDLTIEVAEAMSLSTRTGVALGVAEDLIESVAAAGETMGVADPPASVPDPFRRAFEG
jgi:bifunctional DNase/RNase